MTCDEIGSNCFCLKHFEHCVDAAAEIDPARTPSCATCEECGSIAQVALYYMVFFDPDRSGLRGPLHETDVSPQRPPLQAHLAAGAEGNARKCAVISRTDRAQRDVQGPWGRAVDAGRGFIA
jgi:hypothetical protein